MSLDVMIVDDSPTIRRVLLAVLRQTALPLGKVHEASDGCEAFQKLKDEPVGLILSDISMPNMNGIEFLEKVKADEALKNVPFVMVTTNGSEAKVMEAVKLGAAGYVRKPFEIEQIKTILEGLL
jgi:two-component system chemotaxis response regulator CheY